MIGTLVGNLSLTYEALLYLSIGLLTAVAAIYVFAASLLNSALAAARHTDDRIRRDFSSEFSSISRHLTQAAVPSEEDLSTLQLTLDRASRDLGGTKSTAYILGAWQSALLPGLCFLCSAVLASIPRIDVALGRTPGPAWLLAYLPFAIGCVFLCRVILAVERILTSSTAAISVSVDPDSSPWTRDQSHTVRFRLELTRGAALSNVVILFYTHPADLEVTGARSTAPSDLANRGFVVTRSLRGRVRPSIPFTYEFRHIVPVRAGEVQFHYQVISDSLYTPIESYSLKVNQPLVVPISPGPSDAARHSPTTPSFADASTQASFFSREFLYELARLAPSGPWPKGTNLMLAQRLEVPARLINRAIADAIRLGILAPPQHSHDAEAAPELAPVSPELLAAVAGKLPPQPWPVGTHQRVATELGVAPRVVQQAIKELVRQGRALLQIDGRLYTEIVQATDEPTATPTGSVPPIHVDHAGSPTNDTVGH
jgi:hypothetical protein